MEVLLKNEQQIHCNPRFKLRNMKMRSFSAKSIILVQVMTAAQAKLLAGVLRLEESH